MRHNIYQVQTYHFLYEIWIFDLMVIEKKFFYIKMRSQRKRRKIFHNDIIINVTLSETPHMNDRVYLLETASVVF